MSPSGESPFNVPVFDTTLLTSALANPYAPHYAPHYYQAYVRAYANRPRTTSDGYTLSSTYVPGTTDHTTIGVPRTRPSVQPQLQATVKPIVNHLTFGTWYQSGNVRCDRQGCPFTGSRKSVEIHMMDRHFIFPRGWEKQDGWDADPSLRGKPIAIQGTSLTLDTTEAVDAWIAERKRRFPTDTRIQDKKQKLEEATARGQLTLEDLGAGPSKKLGKSAAPVEGRGRRYQRGRGRRSRILTRHEEPRSETAKGPANQPTIHECAREVNLNREPSTDGDEAPEEVSSKVTSTLQHDSNVDGGDDHARQVSPMYSREQIRTSQPKRPSRNPFVSRPTLLRNLLLPEIHVTVSNLSQAIHFLVENTFLLDVELKPGEAQERMIEVLDSTEILSSAHHLP